jgi:hypothetical protein
MYGIMNVKPSFFFARISDLKKKINAIDITEMNLGHSFWPTPNT